MLFKNKRKAEKTHIGWYILEIVIDIIDVVLDSV